MKNQPNSNYRVNESYRQKGYAAFIRKDPYTKLWAWKCKVDFEAGVRSISTNRSFITAIEAEDHMRQFTHQCIDNRLG